MSGALYQPLFCDVLCENVTGLIVELSEADAKGI